MVAVMKNGIMDTEKLMKERSGREGNMTGMETGIGTLREEEGLKGKTGKRNTVELKRWEYDRYGDRDRHTERRGRSEREDREKEYSRTKEKAREAYVNVKSIDRRHETEKNGGDTFWDSKWEGMQLDERLEKAEAKGRYYLNTKKRFKDATGDNEGTPSLSPSPERDGKKKNKSDSESDTEELVRLKKLRDIQNLKIDGDGMVTGPIADSANYEYDKVTRMFKKKDGLVQLETKKLGYTLSSLLELPY